MKTLTETKTTIDFDIDNCESEAVIENRVVKSVEIRLKGDTGNSFISDDEQFIRDVHKALSGLISHLDKDRGLEREELEGLPDYHTLAQRMGYESGRSNHDSIQ